MTKPPEINVASSAAAVRQGGHRLLSPARYRHPGDVIRLITAGLVLAGALAVTAVTHAVYAGVSAVAVAAVAPSTVAGRVLGGLVQALFAVAAVAAVVVTLRGRRFRLLAGRYGVAITVGSFNFPGSVLLAEIYSRALAARSYPVRILPNLGTRELVDPALVNGLLQLVPEHAGPALELVSLGHLSSTANAAPANRALAKSLAGRGLLAARPAAAQNTNAIVVTAATAARYGLRSITDLARVAPRLVFGGPPECPERAYCQPGLRRAYGLHFKTFIALGAGGSLMFQALCAGDIGVALLFTTDPSISARHLVVLADDRALQLAENITPVARRDGVARYGTVLLTLINAVSARLTTGFLRSLDAQVVLEGRRPRSVAEAWPRARGLMRAGGVGR